MTIAVTVHQHQLRASFLACFRMLARAILGVSLAYVKANQLTDDEDFGLGASGDDDYDLDRDYDEIPDEASGDFQPIKNQVINYHKLSRLASLSTQFYLKLQRYLTTRI